MTATENDALGGAGSIKNALLGIALNGISKAVDGNLSRKYPLASFNEEQTVNASGNTVPAGSPQNQASVAISGFSISPTFMAIALAVALAVLITQMVDD